jgi:hypothetical protein
MVSHAPISHYHAEVENQGLPYAEKASWQMDLGRFVKLMPGMRAYNCTLGDTIKKQQYWKKELPFAVSRLGGS